MTSVPRQRWNRASVIEAAANLADEHGYDALSLALLANHMGVKPPSVYKHVESIDDLKTAIQAYAAAQLNDALTHAAIGRSGDDAIFAIADAYRRFVKAHPGLQVAMSRPSATAHKGRSDAQLEATNQRLLAFAMRMLEGYSLDQAGAINALRTLRSLIHGFVMLETTGSFEMGFDLDQSYRWAIENYILGLRSSS